MKSHLSILLTTILVSATFLHAADTKSGLAKDDETFIKTAAMQGKSEVQISELGEKKASSPDVKHVATMMIADHKNANAELMKLAVAKGVELSVANDPKSDEAIADLEKESGADFDKAYLNQLEKDHKTTIELFEDAVENVKDAEVKAWAAKTLPTLKTHLEHVTSAMKAK